MSPPGKLSRALAGKRPAALAAAVGVAEVDLQTLYWVCPVK